MPAHCPPTPGTDPVTAYPLARQTAYCPVRLCAAALVALLVANPVYAQAPAVTHTGYRPQMPALWDYSDSECRPLHGPDAPGIELLPSETLQQAKQRLYSKHPAGGVITINRDLEVCETLSIKAEDPPLTLRGTGARLPRAYCRSDDPRLGGTVPNKQVQGAFITAQGDVSLAVESLHIDGYKTAARMAAAGDYRFFNVYAHSGLQNGFVNANSGRARPKNFLEGMDNGRTFSFLGCGMEVAHYGQGNHTHNFYMHRSGGGGKGALKELGPQVFNRWSRVKLVDSVVHSARWASNFKSIANENVLINSRFLSSGRKFGIDDGLPEDHAQANIDVPMASENTIIGSTVQSWKDGAVGGSMSIGFRGRKTYMRGNDTPFLFFPYHQNQGGRLATPFKVNPDHPAFTEQWWSERNGKRYWRSLIKDTTISMHGPNVRQVPGVMIYTTRWVWDEGTKQCLLEMPKNAYEMAEVVLDNVRFSGFERDILTVPFGHDPRCSTQPAPPGPSIEDWHRYGPPYRIIH